MSINHFKNIQNPEDLRKLKQKDLKDGKSNIFNEIFSSQKKRIYKALLNSSSAEVNNFNNVLKKIINE